MVRMDKAYSVSLIYRNEDQHIMPCIDSVFNQTIKPKKMVIVDDRSTDSTFDIIQKKEEVYPELYAVQIHQPRHKFKGYNISMAINHSIQTLLTLCDTTYIMRMDSDICLNNPNYVETLLNTLEGNPRIGITGGVSDKGKFMTRHVTDAARIYRRECLLELLKTSPNPGYLILYGHDSFMIFRAKWLGWEVKPVNITFWDARPYRRSMKRWFLTGRFRYMNGFNFIHQFISCIRYFRHKPYFIGSTVAFFTYLLSNLRPYRILDKSYYDFMKRDLKQIVLSGLRNSFYSKILRRTIY